MGMLKAKHKTGLVFFPAFDWAISPTHPEREERLLYTQDQVLEEGLFDIDGITEFKPDLVTVKDIQRVHFCVPDVWNVTTESHFISAGGAKTIGSAVVEQKVDRGFALVRPPGHHAMRVVHGSRGFCNINIEAIMIEYLRRAYAIDRVAIVDTDCHHGDGTQDIYWHDPDTLFISIHQDGRTLYPGSGFPNEQGGLNALGTTVNVPLPPGTSKQGFIYAVENVVMPILEDFKPDIIINSAGQDNHYSDPITNMNFCAQGYAALTEILQPDIAVLEGGYSIEGALPYVNVGIILAMAGIDYAGSEVKHLMQVFVHDVGFEAIAEQVTTPLEGLKVAPYYGCQILRPRKNGEDVEDAGFFEELMTTIGADPISYPLKLKCCGGSLLISNREAALSMINNLLQNALENGADVIATSCPMCQVNLECYQQQVNQEFGTNFNVPVVYFTQLIGLAFGVLGKKLGIGKEIVSATPLAPFAR
jgi:acetoin utilization deacetylase AcuC-like enzyme